MKRAAQSATPAATVSVENTRKILDTRILGYLSNEAFGLISQLRRAAVSIESCIAEGFARYHYKDRLNFYYDARGSVSEVESQSITSKDLGYMKSNEFKEKLVCVFAPSILVSSHLVSNLNGGLYPNGRQRENGDFCWEKSVQVFKIDFCNWCN